MKQKSKSMSGLPGGQGCKQTTKRVVIYCKMTIGNNRLDAVIAWLGLGYGDWRHPDRLWSKLKTLSVNSFHTLLATLRRVSTVPQTPPDDYRRTVNDKYDCIIWMMATCYTDRFGQHFWNMIAPYLLASLTVEFDRAVPAQWRHFLEDYQYDVHREEYQMAVESVDFLMHQEEEPVAPALTSKLPICIDVDVELNYVCPICQDAICTPIDCDYDKDMAPYETICGHVFHRACIAIWAQRKNDCPLCRQTRL